MQFLDPAIQYKFQKFAETYTEHQSEEIRLIFYKIGIPIVIEKRSETLYELYTSYVYLEVAEGAFKAHEENRLDYADNLHLQERVVSPHRFTVVKSKNGFARVASVLALVFILLMVIKMISIFLK